MALVFAERAGHNKAWRNALKGWNLIESPVIRMLLRVLRKPLGELPEELVASIRACTDSHQLDRWLDMILEDTTLEQFRQRVGL